MPRRIGGQRCRRGRRHPDPRLRGAGCNVAAHPQQQRSHPRRLRQQRQSSAGGQVIGARIAPEFDHHAAQPGTAQRVGRRPQHRRRIGQDPHSQPRRIGADRGDAGGMQLAPAQLGIAFAQPDHLAAQPLRQQAGKSSTASRFRWSRRHQLMHPRAHDPATQGAVDPVMPGRRITGGLSRRTATTLNQRDAPLNQGERIDTHMFFICSILCAVYANETRIIVSQWERPSKHAPPSPGRKTAGVAVAAIDDFFDELSPHIKVRQRYLKQARPGRMGQKKTLVLNALDWWS